MIRIDHVDTLIVLSGSQAAGRPGRTYQPPRYEQPGKCQVPGCAGWMVPVREDGERKFICDICQTPADPGLDPGDIENQGHAYSGSAKP